MNHFSSFVLCILLAVGTLRAQRIDTIRPNPAAVPLNKVWQANGNRDDDLTVGGSATLTDGTVIWYVSGQTSCTNCGWYRWDRDGDSARKFQGLTPAWGCTGRFFGTEERYLVSSTSTPYTPDVYASRLVLMRYRDGAFDTTALSAWNGAQQDSAEITFPIDMVATDLDGDNADELIVLYPAHLHPVFDSTGQVIGASGELRPHLRIWRGGQNFALDTPTLVIKDSLFKSTNAVPGKLIVGWFDNDELPDVATIFEYRIDAHDTSFLNIWSSVRGNVWNWQQPHRRIHFPDAYARIGYDLAAFDLDGDHHLDLGVLAALNGSNAVPLYLSRSGKDIMTRSFTAQDADQTLITPSYLELNNWGFLSDSSNRYSMIGLGQLAFYGLSGGPNGPDALWDATGSGLLNPVPIGDATNDGWNDLLVGYPFSGANQGYAALYAGGPYIPHDPTVGVEWTAVAGEQTRAIATWPNPTTDLLHIAWRGDLSRPPRHFAVYDAAGKLVEEWEQWSPFRGEVTWNCALYPAGSYTCRVLDYAGEPLTSVAISIVR